MMALLLQHYLFSGGGGGGIPSPPGPGPSPGGGGIPPRIPGGGGPVAVLLVPCGAIRPV